MFTVLRITAQFSGKGIETSSLFEGAIKKPAMKSTLYLDALEKLAVEQYTRQMEIALDKAVERLSQN